MRAAEKEAVRLLVEAYTEPATTDAQMQAANALAEMREDLLPWGDDFDRAAHLQDVALRAARIVEARGG